MKKKSSRKFFTGSKVFENKSNIKSLTCTANSDGLIITVFP